MTGKIPYSNLEVQSSEAVSKAIRSDELPADSFNVEPAIAAFILERCWKKDPSSRPDMKWCLEKLTDSKWTPPQGEMDPDFVQRMLVSYLHNWSVVY